MKTQMLRTIAEEHPQGKVVLMDSISQVSAADTHHVVVSASHGGLPSADYAARHALAGVFFNDAGVGKDGAGIAALDLLDRGNLPTAVVSHASARIGDAADTWAHGILSFVNAAGRARGLRPGQPIAEAARQLLGVVA